jgi:hypothetical protein
LITVIVLGFQFKTAKQSEMKPKKSDPMEAIRDFSEETSIHGIVHIFHAGQSRVGIVVWILVVISMIILGTYW